MDIALTLGILLAAIILFATDWLRVDVVSLLILTSLALTGLISVEEAFAGFSNPAVITVAAMFIISGAIANTGITDKLGQHILRIAGTSELRLITVVMLVVAFFSAFANNIGAAAVLMPAVVGMAREIRISPSKLLMPLAFGSLVGGLCTLIGTPPNILMNALLQQYTGESFSMFEFTPIGLAMVVVAVAYMALIGRHLLPSRKSGTLTEAYQVKEYITEAEIPPGSPLNGQTIAESALERDLHLGVRAILRGNQKIPFPRRNRKLREGDILFLKGDTDGILRATKAKGLKVVPEKDNPPRTTADDELVVVEASILPTSDIVGKTLREVRFRDTHGLNVLAIWRSGAPVVKKVDHVKLEFGDVLLIQGPEEKIVHLGKEHEFLLLGGVSPVPYNPEKAPLTIAILLVMILSVTVGGLQIMLAATLAAVAMVLSRCLRIAEAYENINWSVIVLIAGTLPLGIALERSGAAKMLADFLILYIGPFGPWVTLGALFLVTFLLTAIMSNAATAVLLAPIAYNAALDLAVDPKPFFMAIAVAASAAFMTPVSHQSNALVMGPGGYRFIDYLKVGSPLNLIVWLLATLLIPLLFPF